MPKPIFVVIGLIACATIVAIVIAKKRKKIIHLSAYGINEAIERSDFIDENGILLDSDLNELRDENGESTTISKKYWKYFNIVNNDGDIIKPASASQPTESIQLSAPPKAVGINFQSKFSIDDEDTIEQDVLDHVADVVVDGYTSGEINGERDEDNENDPPSYTGWWWIDIQEDGNDEDVRNAEVARLLKTGMTSGYSPAFELRANVWKDGEEPDDMEGYEIQMSAPKLTDQEIEWLLELLDVYTMSQADAKLNAYVEDMMKEVQKGNIPDDQIFVDVIERAIEGLSWLRNKGEDTGDDIDIAMSVMFKINPNWKPPKEPMLDLGREEPEPTETIDVSITNRNGEPIEPEPIGFGIMGKRGIPKELAKCLFCGKPATKLLAGEHGIMVCNHCHDVFRACEIKAIDLSNFTG